MELFWIIFIFFLGLAILIKGADVFVDGSAGIARRLKISDFFIGITLVAIGTSLPELIVSLFAGFSNSGELVIGNIVGSNIANIALVLGISGIIKSIKIQPASLIKREIPFIILSGIVLFILGFDQIFQNHHVTFNRLSMGDGLILLAFFVIFLVYIFGNFKSSQVMEAEIEEKEKTYSKETILQLTTKIAGGLLAVIGGGKLVVDNAISLAGLLGISQSAIGLTIVAMGTSLPEAVTTIMAIRKNKTEIAIGNIIGSNTMNIFFILGIIATLTPLELSPTMMMDITTMIAISILLFIIGYVRKEIDRFSGIILFSSYIIYLLFISLREIQM